MANHSPNSAADRHFMLRALDLAARGMYTAHPNPRVGCVLVRDKVVVGEGWHARTGDAHAEVIALADAGEHARGATAYVTLEPCAHHGHTGPCAEALVDAGVVRVVTAVADPNPQVAGAGVSRLAAAGITTEVGLLAAQAQALNAGFFSRMTRQRPFVRLKSAMSLDGRTALANGASFWITGEAARADVHHYRARSSCILSGIGTVVADNPQLTARVPGASVVPALCVVVDSHYRCPPESAVLAHPGGCLIVGSAAPSADEARRAAALEAAGAQVAGVPRGADGLDFAALLQLLNERQINDVLIEAGARLTGAWLRCGLVDEWVVYMAPHLLGHDARALAQLPTLTDMKQRVSFTRSKVETVGQDLKLILTPTAGQP